MFLWWFLLINASDREENRAYKQMDYSQWLENSGLSLCTYEYLSFCLKTSDHTSIRGTFHFLFVTVTKDQLLVLLAKMLILSDA